MVLANSYIDKLSKVLCASEKENRFLNGGFQKFLQIILSLWDSFSSLEDHIWSRILHISQKHGTEENLCIEPESHDNIQIAPYVTAKEKLQKLLAKVEALKRSLIEIDRHHGEAKFDAASESDMTRPDTRGIPSTQETVELSEDLGEPSPNVKEIETLINPKDKVKDIQLDQVSNYSVYGAFAQSKDGGATKTRRSDDLMLELWDDKSNEMPRVSLFPKDTEILADDEGTEKIGCLSGRVAPADILTFDQMMAAKPQKQYYDVWDKVIERLSSHAERLVSLQSSTKELKKKMQSFERGQRAMRSFEYANIKSELKFAEEAILQLINKNKYVKKKAGECSAPANGSISNAGEPEEVKNKKKLVLQQTRRGSRKIGRLELKLQEIQYILVKHEEELKKDGLKEAGGRQSRVVLRDLLYGTKETKKKAPHFCSCVETKSH